MQLGVLAGVALDVFETEPLPADSPLWSLPGVLITPHMAGSSPRYGERLAALFTRNLAAYRGMGEWENRVV
jgi:phosphoglycerate dehydrogenase-like enzyme